MPEKWIIRHEELTRLGVTAPHDYLTKRFGASGTDWHWLLQASICGGDGKQYDQFQILLASGEVLTLSFEIAAETGIAVQERFRQL